ncbi:MAG: hypothetical protein NUK62_00205 [Tenericutes bacterium]|nr:hypothetical protein [Mycoplasmatota bacterium]
MELILLILPLVVIIFFLVRKRHMLVAGFMGGITAIIISWILVGMGTLETGIKFTDMNELIIGVGVRDMLSRYLTPVMYAATAVMISRAGSIKALIEGLNRLLKGKLAWLAASIVLVQGIATYMAGLGAGNTMVIAPLMLAAVGFIPGVVAAMAVATAVGFTTSPASTETSFTATAAGMEVGAFANLMLPFTIIVFLLAAGLAFYSVYKRGNMVRVGEQEESEFTNMPSKQLWQMVIPALVFLVFVVLGGAFNRLFPIPIIVPIINVLTAAILTIIFCKVTPDDAGRNLIDGSKFILTTLFGVGIFLGFINLIGFLGTFSELASLVGQAPEWLVIFLACVLGFTIAIPSGAFAAGVLTLILPTLSLIPGLTPLAFGLIAISVGLGTQISPVQINVAALSDGFQVSIMDIIKGNMRYVLSFGAAIAVVALVVGIL